MATTRILQAASLWYPVMLADERGHLSEAKGAELLGVSIENYRNAKENAIAAVLRLVNELPSPLTSVVDILREKPELFDKILSQSSSSGTEQSGKSA